MPIPPGIGDRPELSPHLEGVWRAFHLLSSSRTITATGHVLPITFTEIDAYARRYGPFDVDDFDEFLTLVGTLDATFIEHAHKDKT